MDFLGSKIVSIYSPSSVFNLFFYFLNGIINNFSNLSTFLFYNYSFYFSSQFFYFIYIFLFIYFSILFSIYLHIYLTTYLLIDSHIVIFFYPQSDPCNYLISFHIFISTIIKIQQFFTYFSLVILLFSPIRLSNNPTIFSYFFI